MSETTAQVKTDFDRLALLSEQHGWNHNDHYHSFLLKKLPRRCGESLDLGCGTGAFTRLLASRSERVLGLDLSPEMVRVAIRRSAGYPNIEYVVADVLNWDFPIERFDCIVSIATLHHLPLRPMLWKMREALKPRGRLIVLDLYQPVTLSDLLLSALAVPVSLVLRLAGTGRFREPREIREAWAEHGRNDRYPTMSAVRRICAEVLPGAKVRRRLLWRYSIVWEKDDSVAL